MEEKETIDIKDSAQKRKKYKLSKRLSIIETNRLVEQQLKRKR